MKHLFFVFLLTFTLQACSTVEELEMPSFSFLNPFSDESTELQEVETPETLANIDETVVATEMEEFEFLTGSSARYDQTVAPRQSNQLDKKIAEVQDKVNEALNDTQPELPQPQEINVEKNVPTAPSKPQITDTETIADNVQENIKVSEVEGESLTTQVTANIIEAPKAEIEEITNDVSDKTIKPTAPLIEETVEVKQAIPPQPVEFNDTDLQVAQVAGCPNVAIFPAARSITNFDDGNNGRLLSRAIINEIRGGCEVVSGGVELDLDILMRGTLTQAGRFDGDVNTESFMTFPYFVSVTTPQGLPVDKKILATAIKFDPLRDTKDHAEKITQFIPIENKAEIPNYKVTVGFQLTRNQLDYNRARVLNPLADKQPALQRRSQSPRISRNPLAE